MTEDGDEEQDLNERFLRANANKDFIASQFADVIRDLMRSVAADGHGPQVYRAAEKMNFIVALLARAQAPMTFAQIFSAAVSEFHFPREDDEDGERAALRAAREGIKYLVESSCSDNAARGRAARRRDSFERAIYEMEDLRAFYRRK